MGNFEKKLPKVKEQLIQLIQRYMETDKIESEESIEAIVVESGTRVKEELAKNSGTVFSVNGKGGKVKIGPRELKAEFSFEKNSSFNKSFGTTKDTITMGNDLRLSDQRVPLPHDHSFSQLIDATGLSANGFNPHRHTNKRVLDLLKRSGTSLFDLTKVDDAMSALKKTVNDTKIIKPQYENKKEDLLIAANAQEDVINTEKEKIDEDTDDAVKAIKELKDGSELVTLKESYVKKAKENSIANQSDIKTTLENARRQNPQIEVELSDKTFSQRFYVKPGSGSSKIIGFETKYEVYVENLDSIKNHSINVYYKDQDGKEFVSKNAIASKHGLMVSYEMNGKNLSICFTQMLKINKEYTGWIKDTVDKKIYALSPDTGTWESVYANNNTDYGTSLAVIKTDRVNSLLAGFDNTWIAGRKMDEEWYWYYDQITYEEMNYSSWGQDAGNEFAVYHNTGWSTGNGSEERKGIIEWNFDDIDSLNDLKIIIGGKRV